LTRRHASYRWSFVMTGDEHSILVMDARVPAIHVVCQAWH
jgi:hypothetical protein